MGSTTEGFEMGTVAESVVSEPRCGRIRTVSNPGVPGSMPATRRRRSTVGCALQACESDRVGSGFSAHVVSPRSSIVFQGQSRSR